MSRKKSKQAPKRVLRLPGSRFPGVPGMPGGELIQKENQFSKARQNDSHMIAFRPPEE